MQKMLKQNIEILQNTEKREKRLSESLLNLFLIYYTCTLCVLSVYDCECLYKTTNFSEFNFVCLFFRNKKSAKKII